MMATRALNDRWLGRGRRVMSVVGAVAGIVLVALLVWATIGRTPGRGVQAAKHGRVDHPVAVRVAQATSDNVDVTLSALGTVAALNTVTIRARVDGPLVAVPFREGQLVKAGELLAQIDPRTYQAALEQAEGQLARDRSQRAGARRDLDRYQELLAKDSIQKQQVEDQAYAVRQLAATIRADQGAVTNARLQVEFTRITAPFDGRVGLRQVDPGNIVRATDLNGIVVLTQTRPIYVVFAVPADKLSRIHPLWSKGQSMAVDALDGSGRVIARGALAAIDNQVDVPTGTVKLKGLFANTDDALFPSQSVTARLTIETLNNVTMTPSSAVQRGVPGTYVYVVNADNTVSLRRVTLGPVSGELVSIQDGLKPGERVVVDGLDKLRDGVVVAVNEPRSRGAAPPGSAASQTLGRGPSEARACETCVPSQLQ